jgi:two-component system NarL family sensor kinase
MKPYFFIRKILLAWGIVLFSSICASATNVDSIAKQLDRILGNKQNLSGERFRRSANYRADTMMISNLNNKISYYRKNNHDSLYLYTIALLNKTLQIEDARSIANAIQKLGRYYILKEDYSLAIKCYLQSLRLEEKMNNQDGLADLYDELGIIYYYQEIFGKSLNYLSKALNLYEKLNDSLGIAKSYSHLGNLHSSREFCETRSKPQKLTDFTLALDYYKKSISICERMNFQPLIVNGWENLAAVYNKLEKPEKALPYLLQAKEYYKLQNDPDKLSGTILNLGRTYRRLKKYDASISCFKECLKISKQNNFTDGIQYLYESMAQTYAEFGDYRNAYENYLIYKTIRDSLFTQEKARNLFDIETKYQSEKKEKEILKLNAEKRQKNTLLISLLSLILIFTFLGYFILKNIRNKKTITEQLLKIKEQQILELEKERQLIATKSVLQGEEAERSRMARDLHDGLGGLLSSVKINLSSMKGNSIISNENAEAFENAIRLLDHSITELRRVAHNMMPETLVHYGLKTAFNEFIQRMGTQKEVIIDFRFFGDEIRFSSELEITLYRIGQELVNNAIKHSSADKISVQFFSEEKRLCFQVLDNGIGFDIMSGTKGNGLESIRNRVDSFNGRFDIWSKAGEGTEATVEFLLS